MRITTLHAKVKKIGGEVTCTSRGGRHTIYNVDAPAGMIWDAAGTHTLVVQWYTGDTNDRDAAIADGLERIEMGVSKCDVEDCDFCAENFPHCKL